ncbi:hypothetical protein JTB14_000107 [Gonioctena quinquepunctata]|nr:hypothetical protein JTB14_000107 [Gonioctena quinquepunctata]
MASDPIELVIKEEPQDPDLLVQNLPKVIKQENDLDFLLDFINVENTPVDDEPNTWVKADNESSEDTSDKDYNPGCGPSHKIPLELLQYSQGSETSSSCGEKNHSNLKCNICEEEFNDDYYFQQHCRSRRLAEKSYKCCGCGKVFRNTKQLNVHTRKHTEKQPYACKSRGKRFSVTGALSKHMRIHTGERRFACDTCDRKFTRFVHLENHMRTHSGEKPFVCDFCNISFKNKDGLKQHGKSHEDTTDHRWATPCPICSRVMKSTRQIMAHLETHVEGPRNLFSCDYCEKAFNNASRFSRHSNSHSGMGPPTGEKPYSCTGCSRIFLTLENLNRHKRTHTGEDHFPCESCGKCFAHSTLAKEHMKVHIGDESFQCEFCDKKYSLSRTRNRHIREKHPAFFLGSKRLKNKEKAREKIGTVVLTDEPYVKKIILNDSNDLKGITRNGARVGRKKDGAVGPVVQKCQDGEDIRVNIYTIENGEEVRVKEEPMEVFIETETDDFDCR